MSDPRPSTSTWSRLRIVDALAAVAIVAATYQIGADLRKIGLNRVSALSVAMIALGIAAYLILRALGVSLAQRSRCPICGDRALGRVAVVAFGPRYYRCGSCHAHIKRGSLGTWDLAGEPGDAAAFVPRDQPSPPGLDPAPEAALGASSLDSLLRNHRHRHGSA